MLPELTRIPGRLTSPKSPQGRPAGGLTWSWDEAMSLVGSRFSDSIRQFGRDLGSLLRIGTAYLTEESYTANKLFKAGIGTNNVDGNPRLCMASAASGYVATYGKDEPPGAMPMPDFAHVFFIIGANPYVCHQPNTPSAYPAAETLRPETVIVCVDPRRTKTAEHFDIHLPVVPGPICCSLNAMASVVLRSSFTIRASSTSTCVSANGDRYVDQAVFVVPGSLRAGKGRALARRLADGYRRVAISSPGCCDACALDDGDQSVGPGRVFNRMSSGFYW